MGEVEHAVDGAEEARMARGAAEREGVLVMHLAADHAPAPGAALGRGAERRVGPEGEVVQAAADRSAACPVMRSMAMPSSMKLMSE